jgi:2-polyprenyl-3-methyl-5-hydroxy-6-metoxy-1,4-benzoquinol methylase
VERARDLSREQAQESGAACWLCGSRRARVRFRSTILSPPVAADFKVTDAHYGRTGRILRCDACGFLFVDPLPTDLLRAYADLEDQDYEADADARVRNFAPILDRLRELRPAARSLLDIGAGTGILCEAARGLGFDAVGVEPSRWAVATAKRRRGLDLLEGTFPHPALAQRRFDVVSLVDVIEHVADPVALLRATRGALAEGGLVVVVTPDIGSLAARLLGQRWWHCRLAHVGYFSEETMRAALAQAGLRAERVEYYRWCFPVGYLAERLGEYVPTRWAIRLARRWAWSRRALERQIHVNLRDSKVYYAGRDS